MCALQECAASTPLLTSNSSETKPADFLLNYPAKHPDNVVAAFTENQYQTLQTDKGSGNMLTSEYMDSSHYANIPSSLEEKQHFKSKNIFQVPDIYSNFSGTPAEVDQLLPTRVNASHYVVREAENLIQHNKKPFSQRSVSDYYLSKMYEESKFSLPTEISDVNPNLQQCDPLEDPQNNYNSQCENFDSNFVLNNSDICSPPDEFLNEAELSEKRNSVHMDCEPTASTFHDVEDTKLLEDKGLYKAGTLNPTVNLKIFDTESLSESGDIGGGMNTDACAQRVLDEAWFIPSSRHTFSGAELSGSASAAQLSIASSFGDSSTPTCKICHMPAKAEDPLISPCRCTGTLHYIHCCCLMKWLEICNKRSRKPPACELCKYQFHWHKKFKVRHWQFPHCSWRDKILHTVFIISVLVMIGCAIVTVMCFRQHRGNKGDITHLELSQSEIITLICGALFFLAFFLAMYVEIKARNTIYKLLVKFFYLNQQWYIDEYDKKGENTVIDV